MNSPTPEHQNHVPTSAGAQLRAYRESAQLTVDDVAHHLKLARRQVLAIENDELEALPGPTFVRGFIRNYARLLRVDPGPLLEASRLSPSSEASASAIAHIAPTMGELPAEHANRASWSRWLIPIGLVLLLVAGIAYYEFGGMGATMRKVRRDLGEVYSSSLRAPQTEPAPKPPATGSDGTQAPPTAPVETQVPQPEVKTTAPPAESAAPSGSVAPSGSPPAAHTEAPAAAMVTSPTSNASSAGTADQTNAGSAETKPQPPGFGRIDLALTGKSWVEIRDSTGALLLSKTLDGSTPQSVSGMPPFSLTIGNARATQVRLDGKPVDLGPYTQREVARLTLPPRR